jgi:hypothetical protein
MKLKLAPIAALLILLSLAILVFTHLYNHYFPPLNQTAVKLFILDKKNIKDEDNVEFSILGLTAPEEVTDIHGYGLDLFNRSIASYSTNNKKLMPLETHLLEIENPIDLEADIDPLFCWLGDYKRECVKCYAANELTQVINRNKVLLDRYKELKEYPSVSSFKPFSGRRQILIDLHSLFLAEIRKNLLSGKKQTAMDQLLEDLSFQRRMLKQDTDLLHKAVGQVLYRFSLGQLEYAITQHPDVIETHYDRLIESLNDLTFDEFNLEGIFRKEFESVRFMLCIDEKLGMDTSIFCQSDRNTGSAGINFIINDYYNFYVETKKLETMEINGMIKECEKQSKGDKNIIPDLVTHILIFSNYMPYKTTTGSMINTCDIMVNFRTRSAHHAILRVYLDIQRKKIDTNKIEAYLQNQAERDPLSGKPFIFNKAENALEFPAGSPEAMAFMKVELKNL